MSRAAAYRAAEMGVAEAARIFEAVAERAVEADMGDPDQRDRQNRGLAGEEAEQRERQRSAYVCATL